MEQRPAWSIVLGPRGLEEVVEGTTGLGGPGCNLSQVSKVTGRN